MRITTTIDISLDTVAQQLAHEASDKQAALLNTFLLNLRFACKGNFGLQTQLLHIWDGLDDDARKALEFIACRH